MLGWRSRHVASEQVDQGAGLGFGDRDLGRAFQDAVPGVGVVEAARPSGQRRGGGIASGTAARCRCTCRAADHTSWAPPVAIRSVQAWASQPASSRVRKSAVLTGGPTGALDRQRDDGLHHIGVIGGSAGAVLDRDQTSVVISFPAAKTTARGKLASARRPRSWHLTLAVPGRSGQRCAGRRAALAVDDHQQRQACPAACRRRPLAMEPAQSLRRSVVFPVPVPPSTIWCERGRLAGKRCQRAIGVADRPDDASGHEVTA